MTGADQDAVIAAARRWLGTPYHDQASLRGVGCDCLGLARGVWRDLIGAEPQAIPPYSRDWGETGAREVLAEGARAMMVEIPVTEIGPGALVLFRMAPRSIAKHDQVAKSAIIPHTKNGNSGSSIHGIRCLALCCAPAMAVADRVQARSWSRTVPVSSEPCRPGCAIPPIVRSWTADHHL